MPPSKNHERKCEICKRSNFNSRMLGPLIHTNSISAHFNCVLYSPVTPDAESFAPRPEDEAVAGVSTRFIRDEGRRAQKLVQKSILINTPSRISHTLFLSFSISACLAVVQFLQNERRTHWVLLRYWHWCSAKILRQKVSHWLWLESWSVIQH